MLDVINALRNNNLRKIPQYDPSLVENARKHVKAVLKNRGLSSEAAYDYLFLLIEIHPGFFKLK